MARNVRMLTPQPLNPIYERGPARPVLRPVPVVYGTSTLQLWDWVWLCSNLLWLKWIYGGVGGQCLSGYCVQLVKASGVHREGWSAVVVG
jgi:hypothetical protein